MVLESLVTQDFKTKTWSFIHNAPEGTEEDGEDDDMFETEFRQYKRTYYMTKIGVEVVSEWVFIRFKWDNTVNK